MFYVYRNFFCSFPVILRMDTVSMLNYVCMCMWRVIEEILFPLLVCMFVFRFWKTFMICMPMYAICFTYIGVSFVLFLFILRMDTVSMLNLCLPCFPRMHQGLYTYMYIFFSSCSMNNCTFVPYIRTYRIFIACTFFAWDMYLLHLSCGSMSECYTPWASALCSLMCLCVEFLVIPAHSSRLLPYNRAYMTSIVEKFVLAPPIRSCCVCAFFVAA
jgi:hypothetical protein